VQVKLNGCHGKGQGRNSENDWIKLELHGSLWMMRRGTDVSANGMLDPMQLRAC
jgi:hypothetical protein